MRFMFLGFQLILAGGFALLAINANSFAGAIALLVMALGLLIGFIGFGMT